MVEEVVNPQTFATWGENVSRDDVSKMSSGNPVTTTTPFLFCGSAKKDVGDWVRDGQPFSPGLWFLSLRAKCNGATGKYFHDSCDGDTKVKEKVERLLHRSEFVQQLLLPEEMTHAGQTSRYFLLFSYQNVAAVPEGDIHMRSVAVPGVGEQMGFHVSAMTLIGRQLAVIGDECDRTYSRKLENSLFSLAKGIVASVFRTCIWSNFKGVAVNTFGSFFNSSWRKIIDSGHRILWLPLKYVCQKWVPATLFALLMWCLVLYDRQD